MSSEPGPLASPHDAAVPPLPDDAPILLFDGDCSMCSASVQAVLKIDRRAQFRFLPIQSERGGQVYRELGLDPTVPDTAVLITGGRAYTKSDCILRAAIMLGLPWSILAVGLLVPGRLRDAIYDVIARNRKRFQRAPRCYIPSPSERDRFLD